MGTPSSKIWPLDGCVSPPSRSMSVDLPQPLGPTSTMNSPSRTLSDTLSSAENLSPERPLRTGNVLLTDTNSILLLALKLSSCAGRPTGRKACRYAVLPHSCLLYKTLESPEENPADRTVPVN